ncbi:integrase family protein [Methylocella silvestris BL2]|uniref:Integrase family protein n=1 Tax=Methylocella silvestris (strain DSM 15510 / CIP 108128 / LMG 27833 / NCIMB 13906 / BL2) TaxID=395965 RepID=B8ESZ9_METSB|nr:site-specific integrase [Methylocella silvestris]ACK51137.1 integrase family protein [Methylocella silvestris BL2]
MVNKINRLSARTVAALTKPGRHADGGNLYLRIERSGSKRWTFMYVQGGRQREAGLGSVARMPLAKARVKAGELRQMLADGIDPLAAKQAEREARQAIVEAEQARRTFGQVADSLLAAKEAGWRNAKHRAQWRMTLETYAASLWNMPVEEVDTQAVLAALQPVWQAKPETASRLRGRIEAVLDAARVAGHSGADRPNPARWKGHLDKLLPAPKKLYRGHHAAMPYGELPEFLARLRKRPAVAALALEFLILTAARSSEVLSAEWSEVDLAAKVWVISARRMKGGREHRVPLSSRALEILENLAKTKTGAFIFSGQDFRRSLSSHAFVMLLRRMKADHVTAHGFRSSFRDWAGDATSFPREIAEAALAHVAGDATELAYRRGDALERRRPLMEDWAAFCLGHKRTQ